MAMKNKVKWKTISSILNEIFFGMRLNTNLYLK